MSNQRNTLPYVDVTRTDDAASTVPPPSFLSAETKSITPLLTETSSQRTQTPQLVTLAHMTTGVQAAAAAAADDDKVIMTSIPITIPRPAQPSKSPFTFHRSKPKTKLKIVLMPRSEYAKYFARDKSGAYIGTEEERSWTEEELEERYGAYKSALPVAPMRIESAWGWCAAGSCGAF
jgi:hypothetical protein